MRFQRACLRCGGNVSFSSHSQFQNHSKSSFLVKSEIVPLRRDGKLDLLACDRNLEQGNCEIETLVLTGVIFAEEKSTTAPKAATTTWSTTTETEVPAKKSNDKTYVAGAGVALLCTSLFLAIGLGGRGSRRTNFTRDIRSSLNFLA